MKKRYSVPNGLSISEQRALVLQGDRSFDGQMENVAGFICEKEALRFVGLTGPTCSGKTTAAQKLSEMLAKRQKTLRVISVDDFYYDKTYLHALAEKNGREEPDYDSEETIDVALLERCVESLLTGKQTVLPHFNFQTGMREWGAAVTPRENDLFLLEGIQILYPKVEKILSQAHCKTVYIAPMSEIEAGGITFAPHEIRFLRRIVRDFRFRNTSAEFTFRIWQSVRQNEEAHIFPYTAHCHAFVDSTMPYELGVLKPYLEEILSAVSDGSPYAESCARIMAHFSGIETISSEYLSEKSLYKEFI